jgi:hypothetical protein
MIKPIHLSLLPLLMVFSAQSAISVRYDEVMDCQRYNVINEIRNDAGEYVLERELLPGEEVIDNRVHYGLSTANLTINFEEQKAEVEIIKNVALGINRNLIDTDTKVSMDANHPQLNTFLNTLNRRVFLFDDVCVRGSEVIDFSASSETLRSLQ